jgi:hypothetical protein
VHRPNLSSVATTWLRPSAATLFSGAL